MPRFTKINFSILLLIVSLGAATSIHNQTICNLAPKFSKTASPQYWYTFMTSYFMWYFMIGYDPSTVVSMRVIDIPYTVRATEGQRTVALGLKKWLPSCSVLTSTTLTETANTASVWATTFLDNNDYVPHYNSETSNKMTNIVDHPATISTQPSNKEQALKACKYMHWQGWHKMAMITTLSSEVNEFVSDFQNCAGEYGIDILASPLIPIGAAQALANDTRLFDQPMKIVENSGALIIVIAVPPSLLAQTIAAAKRAGFNSGGKQMVLIEAAFRRIDIAEADVEARTMIRGMVSFSNAIISQDAYNELASKWASFVPANGLTLTPAHLNMATSYRIHKILSEIYYNCTDSWDATTAMSMSANALNYSIILPSDFSISTLINCSALRTMNPHAAELALTKGSIRCNKYIDTLLKNGRSPGVFVVINHLDIGSTQIMAMVDENNNVQKVSDVLTDVYMGSDGTSTIPPDVIARVEVKQSDGIQTGTLVIVIIAAVFIVSSAVAVYVKRSVAVVRTSAYKFLLIAHLGALLGLAAGIVIVQNPTIATCNARWWLCNFAFDLLFGTLFVKSYRIHRIFNNKIIEKLGLTDEILMLYVAAAVLVDVVLGSCHEIFSPYDVIMTDTMIDPKRNFYMSCDSANEIWFIGIPLGLKAFSLIIGTSIAVEIRNVKEDYNESKMLAIAIGGCTIIASLVIAILFALPRQPLVQMPAAAWSMIIVPVGCILLIIVPKYGKMFTEPVDATATKKRPIKLVPSIKIIESLEEIARAIAHGGYSSQDQMLFGLTINEIMKSLGDACLRGGGSAGNSSVHSPRVSNNDSKMSPSINNRISPAIMTLGTTEASASSFSNAAGASYSGVAGAAGASYSGASCESFSDAKLSAFSEVRDGAVAPAVSMVGVNADAVACTSADASASANINTISVSVEMTNFKE